MNDDLKIVIPIEIDKLKSDDNIKAYLKSIQDNIELKLTIADTPQQQSRIIQQANDVIENIAKNIDTLKPQIDFEQFSLNIDSANDKLKAIKNSLEDFKDSANINDFQIFKDLSSQDIFENLKNSFNNFKDLPIKEVTPPYKKAKSKINEYNNLIDRDKLTDKDFDRILKQSDKGFSDYLKAIKGSKGDFDSYNKSIGNTSQALALFTLKAIGAELAQTALSAATSMGISLLVDFAVSGVMKLVQAHQEAIEKSKKITSEFKDFRSEVRDNISSLKSLESEYNKLSLGIDENGNNIGLSSEEYRRYKEIMQQIAEISPSLIVGYDDEGNAIISRNNTIEEAIRLQKELNELKTAEYLDNGEDVLKGARNKAKDIQSEIDKAKRIVASTFYDPMDSDSDKTDFLAKVLGVERGNKSVVSFINTYQQEIIDNIDRILSTAKAQNVFSEKELQIIDNQVKLIRLKNKELEKAPSDVVSYLQTYASSDTEFDWFENIKIQNLDVFNNALKTIASDSSLSLSQMKTMTTELGEEFVRIQNKLPIDEINELNNAFNEGTVSEKERKEKLAEYIDQMNSAAGTLDKNTIYYKLLSEWIDKTINHYSDLSSTISDVSLEEFHNLKASSFDELNKKIEESSSNLSKLGSVYEALNNEQQVSTEDLTELINLYPQYSAELSKINDDRNIGKELIRQLFDAENAEILNSLAGTAAKIKSESELESLRKRLLTIYDGYGGGGWIPQEFLEIQKIISESENALEVIEALMNSHKSKNIADYISTASPNSLDKSKEIFEKLYADLQHQREMDEVSTQEYYNKLKQLNKDYLLDKESSIEDQRKIELELYKLQRDISSEHIADIEHEIAILETQDKTEQQRINLYKNIQDELHKQAEHARSLGLSDNHDYIQELQKQWLSYADKIKSTEEDLAKKVKEAKENALKDEIDILDKRKLLYESVVNAVTATIDKEVKSTEDAKNAFVKSIDEKIDKLNEEKDSLSKLQKEYETAFSVVNYTINEHIEKLNKQRSEEEKSWNDKINALKEQNDEIEKQIELEKAQESLEKSRNQKNTLIYREGIGFEYESNFDEVNKAKESLDNLNRKLKLEEETKALEELRDNALEIIDSQIKGWEEYGQKWSDVVDNYRKDQDLLIAQQILGKNWESDILHQRTDRLGEFANEYADISYKLETEIDKQIADLEREKETQIEVYDAKIEKLNEYKAKWTEIVDNYTLEQDRLKAAQILGADWEREILDSRLSTFKTFRDEYIGILEDLTDKQEQLSGLQSEKDNGAWDNDSSEGGSYNGPYATIPGYGKTPITIVDGKTQENLPIGSIVHTAGGDFRITGGTPGNYTSERVSTGSSDKNENNGNVTSNKVKDTVDKVIDRVKDTVGKIFGFADGTSFAPGGLSVVDELGQEMIVRNPFQGRYTYLENGDGVIPHNITETLMKLGSNPIDYLKQSIGDIRIPKTINNQPIQEIIDIGDIKVYGVQNVDGLANAIITELPNMMLQKLYRK